MNLMVQLKSKTIFPKEYFLRAFLLFVVLATSYQGSAAELPFQLDRQADLWSDLSVNGNQQVASATSSLIMERLRTGNYGPPEDYKLEVEMEWAANFEPGFKSREYLGLGWPVDGSEGWVRNGNQVFHPKGDTGGSYDLSFNANDLKGELADYNSLLIDYRSPTSIQSCKLSVAMLIGKPRSSPAGEVTEGSEYWLASYNYTNSNEIVEEVNARESVWEQKRFGYILGRMLGTDPGENWYYAQDGGNAVVQRRLHWALDTTSVLDVRLTPGTPVSFINLLIGFSDRHGRGELLNVPVTNPGVLPDGSYGVRLNLGSLLNQRFPGKSSDETGVLAYLQEVIIFLPGSSETVVQRRNVQALTLYRGQSLNNPLTNEELRIDRNIQPLATTLDMGGGRKRLSIDLTSIFLEYGMPVRNLELGSGLLHIVNPDDSNNCGFTIDSISLGSSFQRKVPVYLGEIARWVRSSGGPFISGPDQNGFVEGVEFEIYSDLSSFTKDKSLSVNGESGPENDETSRVRTSWRNPEGFVVMADEETDIVGGPHMVVSGTSPVISMRLEKSIALDGGDFLYLGAAQGSEHISSVQLKISGDNGELWQRIIQVNSPISLKDAPAALQSFEITFQVTGSPYHIELSELSIFSPRLVSSAQALDLKIPYKLLQELEGEISGTGVMLLDSGPENIVTQWQQEALGGEIATALRHPVQRLEKLRVSYRLPQEWLGEDGCVLTFALEFSGETLMKNTCLRSVSGMLEFSGEDLGLDNLDVGPLENIVWMLDKPPGSEGELSMNVSVSGASTYSVWELLRYYPLLRVAGENYYAAESAFRSARAIAGNQSTFFLELPVSLLQVLQRDGVLIEGPENPWARVKRLMLRPQANVDNDTWRELIAPEALPVNDSGSMMRLWLGAAAILGAVLLMFNRSQIHSKVNAMLKYKKMKVAMPVLTAPGHATVKRWLKWGNLAMGMLGAPALILIAGSLGLNFRGTSVLLGGIVLGAGCGRIGEYLKHDADYSGKKWQYMHWVGMLLAAAHFLWALGSIVDNPQWLWGALPVACALYGATVEIFKVSFRTMKISSHFVWGCFWMGVTAFFFFNGLALVATSRINVYFTFGGISAVAASWYMAIAMRHILEKVSLGTAKAVYKSNGTVFMTISLLLLGIIILLLTLSLQLAAAQLSVIFVYCVFLGISCEIIASWKKFDSHSMR
jgi:hypothetical protein